MADKTDPKYLNANHQRIVEFADDYFPDPEEHDLFVDEMMERQGFVRTEGWKLPEPDELTTRRTAKAAARPPYFKSGSGSRGS